MSKHVKNLIASAAFMLATGAAQAANIVEIAVGIAVGDERFTTLVVAVQAADLADALSGPGSFTVFAPVNEAFAALPEGAVETLLMPEYKGQLTDMLLYHVDDRELTAGQIPQGSVYVRPLLASERFCLTTSAGGVLIADGTGESANVVIAEPHRFSRRLITPFHATLSYSLRCS